MRLIEGIRTRLNEGEDFAASKAAGYAPLGLEQYRKFNRFRPDGAKRKFCYLPFNSLTFSFNGEVYVCSYNRDVQLGHYPENSISEIWQGEQAQKLRQHMQHNDLSQGCGHCKFFFDKGKFSNLRPLVFDKYYQHTNADYPRVFEFELSNTCNLECQMCHGEVSSSIRKNRDKLPPLVSPYNDAFVQQLRPYIANLKEAKFYGGEPFLIPIYYKIWDAIQELNPNLDLFVITNGTQWNDRIERLLNDLRFDVAISIDAAEKEVLERIRKNVVYEELMKNIDRFSKVCRHKGTNLSLSYTVQRDNWAQFPKMIEMCNAVGAYIYVSYLERPRQFALAELSTDELKRIRDYMEGYSPKGISQKERHNRKCFEDFKTYLDSYIANSGEKHYHEYEYAAVPPTTSETQSFEEVVPVDSEEAFEQWIDGLYASLSESNTLVSKENLIYGLREVMDGFSLDEQALLRAFAMRSDLIQLQLSIRDLTIEEVKEQSRKALATYRLSFSPKP